MYFQPVSRGESAIGRALAAGIQQVGHGLAVRSEVNEEKARREAELRSKGIVPLGEVRTRLATAPGPTVELPQPQMSPIARAASGQTQVASAGEAIPAVSGSADSPPAPRLAQSAPRPRTVQMAGAIAPQQEEHVDLGDGSAYVPRMDQAAQIAAHQARVARQAEQAERAAAESAMLRRILPAADRYRSGHATTQDMLVLAAAGVPLKDLEDPESALNREIDREKRLVTARNEAEEPFEIRNDERDAATQRETDTRRHQQTLAEVAARGAQDRESISTRNTTGSQTVNWETNPRTARAYGFALANAQAPGNHDQNDLVRWLGENFPTLTPQEKVAIAGQAWRDARGTVARGSPVPTYVPGGEIPSAVNPNVSY